MSERPNILFFFADDQRFDTVGALGNDDIRTPALDALVREGTAFTHAHIMGGSCGAVCMPSRAMLMTGRTLFHLDRQGQDIPADHVLLGELLRRHGYVTFGTGKWHNGTASYARSFSAGAEIFFGGMDDHWNVPACDFDPTGRYPEAREHSRSLDTWYDENGRPFKRVHTNRQVFDHTRAGRHSSDLFGDAAVEFLRSHDGDQPFFLYVSFMAPHDPRETHPQYHELYDPERMPLPESFTPEHPFDNGDLQVRDEHLAPFPRTEESVRRQLADYYAMISHLDAQIERVLGVLEETGRAGNTIIVFAGDNGLAVGRHGLMGKQNLYDHSVRVPLILHGPGVPRGETRAAFCYLLDIYPTLCDLIGVEIPDSVEGRSLAPVLHTAGTQVRDRLHFAYKGIHRGVRDERLKLIEYVVGDERHTQLFDLEADPFELKNLAGDPDYAGHLERLRYDLLAWRDELDDTQDLGREFWEGYLADGQ